MYYRRTFHAFAKSNHVVFSVKMENKKTEPFVLVGREPFWTVIRVNVTNSILLFPPEKITQRKRQHGGQGQKSFNAIEEFCERFDKAVKNTLAQV